MRGMRKKNATEVVALIFDGRIDGCGCDMKATLSQKNDSVAQNGARLLAQEGQVSTQFNRPKLSHESMMMTNVP